MAGIQKAPLCLLKDLDMPGEILICLFLQQQFFMPY